MAVQSGYAQQSTAAKPKPESRQDAKQKSPVKAESPTVVTVKGKLTELEQRQATPVEPDRNFGQKVGHGIKTGVVGTARGIVKGIGWLLDPKNDLPDSDPKQAAKP